MSQTDTDPAAVVEITAHDNLRDIPAPEVSRLLASVQRVRRRFYFPRTASLHQEGDAVDVIVRTIVEHFRGLLGIHAWHGGLPELP